jgi:hypothetical protein
MNRGIEPPSAIFLDVTLYDALERAGAYEACIHEPDYGRA